MGYICNVTNYKQGKIIQCQKEGEINVMSGTREISKKFVYNNPLHNNTIFW